MEASVNEDAATAHRSASQQWQEAAIKLEESSKPMKAVVEEAAATADPSREALLQLRQDVMHRHLLLGAGKDRLLGQKARLAAKTAGTWPSKTMLWCMDAEGGPSLQIDLIDGELDIVDSPCCAAVRFGRIWAQLMPPCTVSLYRSAECREDDLLQHVKVKGGTAALNMHSLDGCGQSSDRPLIIKFGSSWEWDKLSLIAAWRQQPVSQVKKCI